MPDRTIYPESSVITLDVADRACGLALGHWNRAVDQVVEFLLKGGWGECIWRNDKSGGWKPMLQSTAVRLVQNTTRFATSWFELQNPDHEIMRVDLFLREQVAAEAYRLRLPQSKGRERGRFTGRDGETNEMVIRVPHR